MESRDLGVTKIIEGNLSSRIIRAAIEVHRNLGPGLLESVYRRCLLRELRLSGLPATSEVPIPICCKGESLDCGFRADVIVQETVLVELKAVDHLLPIHDAQLLTYLKLCDLHVGLLLNFNTTSLRHGIRRLVR